MVRTDGGRGRGRGGRSGRHFGRGTHRKRSVRWTTSPSKDAQNAPSVSSNPLQKKYRSFEEDDHNARTTLIDQAAKARIRAMQNNTKNPGRIPHGFGTKQIKHFASSCPGLNIEEYDVYNRVKAIQNKEKDEQKKRQDVEAQRAAALRLEEVRGEVTSPRIAPSSPSASHASPVTRSALDVLASVAVSRSPTCSTSDAQSDAVSSIMFGLPNRCHFAKCGAPGDQIPMTCGNPNCNRTLHVCCLINAQVQAGLTIDLSQKMCDRCFTQSGDGTDHR